MRRVPGVMCSEPRFEIISQSNIRLVRIVDTFEQIDVSRGESPSSPFGLRRAAFALKVGLPAEAAKQRRLVGGDGVPQPAKNNAVAGWCGRKGHIEAQKLFSALPAPDSHGG